MAISPQTIENTREVKQKLRLPFALLSDAGNAYADELRLAFTLPDDLQEVYAGFGVDLPTLHDDTSWRLPLPTRIVVKQDGAIADIAADPDYTMRPEVATTLAALRRL